MDVQEAQEIVAAQVYVDLAVIAKRGGELVVIAANENGLEQIA